MSCHRSTAALRRRTSRSFLRSTPYSNPDRRSPHSRAAQPRRRRGSCCRCKRCYPNTASRSRAGLRRRTESTSHRYRMTFPARSSCQRSTADSHRHRRDSCPPYTNSPPRTTSLGNKLGYCHRKTRTSRCCTSQWPACTTPHSNFGPYLRTACTCRPRRHCWRPCTTIRNTADWCHRKTHTDRSDRTSHPRCRTCHSTARPPLRKARTLHPSKSATSNTWTPSSRAGSFHRTRRTSHFHRTGSPPRTLHPRSMVGQGPRSHRTCQPSNRQLRRRSFRRNSTAARPFRTPRTFLLRRRC